VNGSCTQSNDVNTQLLEIDHSFPAKKFTADFMMHGRALLNDLHHPAMPRQQRPQCSTGRSAAYDERLCLHTL